MQFVDRTRNFVLLSLLEWWKMEKFWW